MRFKIILFILIASIFSGLYMQRVEILDLYRDLIEPSVPEAVTYEEVVEMEKVIEVAEVEEEIISEDVQDSLVLEQEVDQEEVEAAVIVHELPASVNLAVPFTPQAPHANWELPYQEACEEASVFMVQAYYDGKLHGAIEAEVADEGILKLVEFQNVLFGDYKDTTAEQTATFAEQFYLFPSVEVVENPTVEDIKEHLADGRPVIVPAAGRQLGNPYFTAPGPLYHMLVIRGYTVDGFITNDPGTRQGEEYVYQFETIMNSMHDWNGGDVENGGKRIIIVYAK